MKKLRMVLMALVLMPMMALATGNLYMVIDLSGGPSATSYPVSYLGNVPTGGWTDEYKTTKLVMRRIPAGTFMMGDGKDSYLQEVTGKVQGSVPVHSVSLTKDFYIGVFEVTQRQWELVMGSNPSYFSGYSDSSRRPVETVSYNMIRGKTLGAEWPQSSDVDDGSFLAVIRSKAKLDNLDLPTSAQWEYACRAGTSTDLNTGVNLTDASTDSKLDGVGWYSGNSSACTHEVGLCMANNWGLYDMHGNVWEWCLDWYDYATGEPAIDPVGPATRRNWGDASRVFRGGSHNTRSGQCRSANEADYGCYRVDHLWGDFGFRLAMTVTDGSSIAPTDGLVAYYPFDGNANDASGNGNHGTTHGVTLTEDRFGNANGAYYFGNGNYIAVPNSSTVSGVSEAITISAWVKIDDWYANHWAPIVCKGRSSWAEYSLNLTFARNDTIVGEHINADFATTPALDEWCHVAVTYGSDLVCYAYVNGVCVGTKTNTATFSTSTTTDLEIGRDVPGATEYLYGALDDVRIYNRALSAAEVKALYDGTPVAQPTTWYVNGSSGADSDSGTSASSAKATIQAAIDASSDGDTILVAPGTYAPITTANKAITIRGTAGAASTIIDAKGTSHRCVTVRVEVGDGLVCTNTIVVGFTLQNGEANLSLDYYGEGGGCAEGGTYKNCILLNGVGAGGGNAGSAVLENCLVRGGTAYNGGNVCGCIVHNCTILDGNALHSGSAYYNCSVYNSICIGTSFMIGPDALVNAEQKNVCRDDPGFVDAANGDYRLVAGSPCIDAGDNSFVTSDKDLAGNTRIVNGTVDIGCYEYNGAVPPPVVTYAVTFNVNGAGGTAPSGRSVTHGAAVGELPMVSREGYTFLGWFTAASGGSQVSASTVVTANVTYYAQWRINSYTVTFNLNGAGGTAPSGRSVTHGAAVGELPTVSREGYTFLGWFTAASGGTQVSALTAVTGSVTYYAQWLINSYTVTFDAQGGAGGGTVARNHGAALGELPVPTRDGFTFDGWFTAASGGSAVSTATVIMGNVTFYAHWTEQALYPTPVWYDDDGEEIDWTEYYDGDEEPFAAESAATFDGYVLDGEELCGIVQVKVGKANKNTKTSKVTASLTLLGETKKLAYKGVMSKLGIAELTCAGKGNLSLCLGTNAMWGEVDGLTVSGARNVFAKAGDPKASVLSKWQGSYALVLETVDAVGGGEALAWGYNGLSVNVGAKGKVKIQGTMVDGAKVNVTSQMLVGEKRCCIPVVVPLYTKKGGFGFNLWLHDDGAIEVGEMSAWDATAAKPPFMAVFGEDVVVSRSGVALPSVMSFMFEGEPDIDGVEVLSDFLPWEVEFSTGGKWKLPAAGNIKYDSGAEEWYDAKDSENPAGLKLTYVSKTGTFKGSFKIYAVNGAGKMKKYTANVSGIMVGRRGYGTATVKNVGSWTISIE